MHPDTVTPNNPTGVFEIEAKGCYKEDKKALYEKAGKAVYEKGYEVHHIAYDRNNNTMLVQVVNEKDHRKSHDGGVKEYREAHNGRGYEPRKPKTKPKK